VLILDRSEEMLSANTLNIACLPLSTRQSQLRELLLPYGEIRSIKIMQEKSSKFVRQSSSAIVVFEKPFQAEKAQTAIDGRYMGEGWRLKASWGDREQQKSIPIIILVDCSERYSECAFRCIGSHPSIIKITIIKGTTTE
jgi:RNA recognition motif-containing protein